MSKSTKWFLLIMLVLAVLAIGFTLIVLMSIGTGVNRTVETVSGSSGEKIALVELRGVIMSSEEIVDQLKRHRENDAIKGILLRIESPGGGVVASQEIYEEVRKTRDAGKPVVVSMGALAASGGYYVACGSSLIVANRGTLTGSIGVVSEFLQLQDALDKLGISVKTIKSGRLKDAGSSTRKMTELDERYIQELMDDVHSQFVGVVETERGLEHVEALALADGRVFTGEQAFELGLVDTVGTYEDAIQIAGIMAGIEGTPTVVKERRRRSLLESWFGDVGETVAGLRQELLGMPALSYRFTAP